MKKGYMIYPHWWETIKKLPREDKGELMEVVMEYINYETVIDMSFTVELVFTPILEQFKIDKEKYIETCKKRQEAGKKGGIAKAKQKVASASKSYQSKANSSDNDKDNDKEKDNEIIVSKDTELTLKPITVDINNLIQELKEQADILGIAYDKNKERMFAKHIMNTKEYGSFCEKLGMTRVEFAKNIMKASERIGYWKGSCSGPMSIYQNYSDVYNQTKTKSESSKPKESTGYEGVAIITDEI